MKSTWKADFTYFPSAENKARFGDHFSKSKWIKSSSGRVFLEMSGAMKFDELGEKMRVYETALDHCVLLRIETLFQSNSP